MSLVIPLEKCIARPEIEGKDFLLKDHLLKVAYMSGNPDGTWREKLLFLAGLLHDAGKARTKWQQYINNSRKKGSVSHSPLGAVLFYYCACKWFEQYKGICDEDDFVSEILELILAISNHHGSIYSLQDEPPFQRSFFIRQLEEVDIEGIFKLVRDFFDISISYNELIEWLEDVNEKWEEHYRMLQRKRQKKVRYLSGSPHSFYAKCNLKLSLSQLVSSDRFHAADIERVNLIEDDAVRASDKMINLCKKKVAEFKKRGQYSELVEKRQYFQEMAVEAFKKSINEKIYSLLMPTGTGKTLTALRLALTSCSLGYTRKIIYVAPYLSILYQAADEISSMSGLEVLQHHYLSVAKYQEIDDREYLALESWQAPIVVTTFNQFFRAIFPAKAQQAMRLTSLQDSFIIIDEPQILNPKVWNLFLTMIKALTEELGVKVLFSTATLPPPADLDFSFYPLAGEISISDRYVIEYLPGGYDQEELTQLVIDELKNVNSIAVIMNTVKDAGIVYDALGKRLKGEGVKIKFISGAMTPLHKNVRIKEIKEALGEKAKTVVVCTQILEAGVDLSFSTIYRATPIIPSIVQAAGRANRHGDGPVSKVKVFDFLRDGEIETQKFVYRSSITREETFKILKNKEVWRENESQQVVTDYYRRVLEREANTAYLRKLEEALGDWSAVSKLEPYDQDYASVRIFVPWGQEHLPKNISALLDKFAPDGVEQLYEKYAIEHLPQKLSFLERKQFMTLLGFFTVEIPVKDAAAIAEVVNGKPVTKIKSMQFYCNDMGLSKNSKEGMIL